MAESYTEDGKYLYRFHPCNDILRRLYEVFKKSKKQDLTPWVSTRLFVFGLSRSPFIGIVVYCPSLF